MTSKILVGLPPDRLIIFRLTVVIAAYALLAFAGKRRWLRPQEVLWIGLAELFWTFAWLIAPVLIVVRSHMLGVAKCAAISAGLVAPVLIAMGVGLRFIIKAAGETVEVVALVRKKAKRIR